MRAGGLRALFGGSSSSPAHTPPAGSVAQSAAASPNREQDRASPPATTTRTPDNAPGAGAASAAGSSGGAGAKAPSSQQSQEKGVQTDAALMGALAPGQVRAGEALEQPAPKRPRLMSGMEAVWKVFEVSQPLPPAWNSPLPADLGF